MAITLTKEIEGVYPAYNNSFIEFTSDLANNDRAEIILTPSSLFPQPFEVFPDPDGVYLFNVKEAIKVVFNQKGFEDLNFDTSVYSKSIEGIRKEQTVQIKVYNDTTNESKTITPEFYKAVKQIGENVFNNLDQICSYSKDGINFYMPYFEGFPFHFDILKVGFGNEIKVKSLNTLNEHVFSNPDLIEQSYRINIDKGGGENWTIDNIIPLIVGVNRLEVYEDGNFSTNIELRKYKKSKGVYLKWFNNSGGYNHYLFDEYFIDNLSSLDIGRIFDDSFNNLQDSKGEFVSVGKNASGAIQVKTKYNCEEYEYLKSILASPYIEMYTSKEAYLEGRFVRVFVEGSIAFANKKHKNELSLNIELAEIQTIKL